MVTFSKTGSLSPFVRLKKWISKLFLFYFLLLFSFPSLSFLLQSFYNLHQLISLCFSPSPPLTSNTTSFFHFPRSSHHQHLNRTPLYHLGHPLNIPMTCSLPTKTPRPPIFHTQPSHNPPPELLFLADTTNFVVL